jgi:hypothetical protein
VNNQKEEDAMTANIVLGATTTGAKPTVTKTVIENSVAMIYPRAKKTITAATKPVAEKLKHRARAPHFATNKYL